MKKTRARLALQHAIAALLADAVEPKNIVLRVLRMVCENIGWLAGVLWVPNSDGRFLRCAHWWKSPGTALARFGSRSRRYRFTPGVGLPGRVWQSGRPAWISNVRTDSNFPRFRGEARDGLHGAFAFPIHVNGEVVAVMEFFSDKIQPPDRALLQSMATAGGQLGQFLARGRAQDEARRERALLRAQGELSPEGILVVNQRGRIVSFNQQFVSMWGIPDAVIKRKSDDEALAGVLGKLVDPQGFIARVRHLYRNRSERSSEEITLKDGRIFARHSAPIFSGSRNYYGRVWYFRDVTELKRAAAKLSASEEKYHKLFSSAAHAILLIDAKTRKVIDANMAARKLYGYTLQEFMRLDFHQLSAKREKTGGGMRQASPKSRAKISVRYHKRKNGVKFPVEITSGAFRAGGRKMIIEMVTDLSDRLRAQEVAELRQKIGFARDFIANASHELRSPTAVILAFSETLLGGASKRSQRRDKFVQTIHRHAVHLHRLLDDLLDMARLDSGKSQAHPKRIPLTRYLGDFLRQQAPGIRRKGIRIRIDLRKSVFISMDETQLRRVISNLLDNAVKYTSPRGLITVSLRASLGRAVIAFTDSGIGISKKDLPLIFNRFHRADTAFSHKIKGTGLGLSLVKEIVTAQGGSIWAESSEGRGSTFYVALPFQMHEIPVRRAAQLSPN